MCHTLCASTLRGDTTTIDLLLRCGATANAVDQDGRSVVHLASTLGNEAVVFQLIEHKADLNVSDRRGVTPLANAVQEGHRQVASMLRDSGAKLLFDRSASSGMLCEKANRGDLDGVRLLASAGCDVNAADYDARTCLMLAAASGNLMLTKDLLASGADVNMRDRWGNTPLAEAVREGHHEVAYELHRAGGKLEYSVDFSAARLCQLARKGDTSSIRVLISVGLDINSADYDGRTCLMLASSTGNIHVVKVLLDAKAELNAKDRWGGTALLDAVRGEYTHVAKVLLAAGATLEMDATATASKLCECAEKGQLERLDLMLQCKCDINATDYDARTVLHVAASCGHCHIVQHLVGRGVRCDVRDRWGGTPLDDAVRGGYTHIVNFLKQRLGTSDSWSDAPEYIREKAMDGALAESSAGQVQAV